MAAKDGAIANVYSILSMSSVATVQVAGNVQAKSIPPEPPRILAPKPMSIGIGREFALVNQVRAISSSVSRLR